MKSLTLFFAGFFVGVLCCRRHSPRPGKLAVDIDELATPTLFRCTTRVRLDPVP